MTSLLVDFPFFLLETNQSTAETIPTFILCKLCTGTSNHCKKKLLRQPKPCSMRLCPDKDARVIVHLPKYFHVFYKAFTIDTYPLPDWIPSNRR